MLVLSREQGQSVLLTIEDITKLKNGDTINILCVSQKSPFSKKSIQLGIDAPKSISIKRIDQ